MVLNIHQKLIIFVGGAIALAAGGLRDCCGGSEC